MNKVIEWLLAVCMLVLLFPTAIIAVPDGVDTEEFLDKS